MTSEQKKPLILAVDDTPENLDVVKGILSDDYTLRAAINGKMALKIAEAQLPDLILLDVMMPEMDGYEVCMRLKENPKTKDIPVIFLTAKGQTEDEAKGLALGASDYIMKPVSPPILVARVKTHLALQQSMHDISEKSEMLEALSGKLAKYLSPQIYQSIFSGDKDVVLSNSRKKLTIFFSDIVNFTSTTEKMEPEELSSLLNQYLTEMTQIALKYGATVDKYIGDAILAFFGDPETKGPKEDALACVHMAIEMKERLDELEVEWKNQGVENPFRIRVGISTGYCTVGNFGSSDRMDYTIIGNMVNLAARLESAAEPDQILMSHETYSLVKEEIDGREEEPLKVKGFDKPVHCHSVIGAKKAANVPDTLIKKEANGINVALDLSKETPDKIIGSLEGLIQQIKDTK